MGLVTLKEYLTDWTLEGRTRGYVAETVLALAETSVSLSELVGQGALAGKFGRVIARTGENDEQKEIDVLANNMIAEALKPVPVAALASEEAVEPIALQSNAPLLVATDPLDGSSNVDANVSFGTIFSILPRHPSILGRSRLSSSRFSPACSWLCALRSANSAGPDRRPRNARVHPR